MSVKLNEYRTKQINSILAATSQEEVKSSIDTTIRMLKQSQVHAMSIPGFVDEIIAQLELFNPMNKNAQQWSNIQVAKIFFYRLKYLWAIESLN